MTTSVAKDIGAMVVGRGSTGAGMTVLALRGCLTDRGRSRDCSLWTAPDAPLAWLSDLIFSQARFLVQGRDTLLGSCEDSIQESRSSSCLIRTGQVTPQVALG